MKVIPVCPGSAMANCYLLVHGSHALVVDPCVTVSGILRAAQAEGATLEGILLTHGHFDHILTLDALRDAAGIPAYIHDADQQLLPDGQKNAFALFFGQDRAFRPAEHSLRDGDLIPLGDAAIEVIPTPGHTGGSVCYRAGDILLTGDTLFVGGYGRCDLKYGSETDMFMSLKKLYRLPAETVFLPGHGGSSTIGRQADFGF